MDVAAAAFVMSLILGCIFYFLVSKPRQHQKNSSEDYKRLFDGIPTPMYIYDDRTFQFLAVNDAAIEQVTPCPRTVSQYPGAC